MELSPVGSKPCLGGGRVREDGRELAVGHAKDLFFPAAISVAMGDDSADGYGVKQGERLWSSSLVDFRDLEFGVHRSLGRSSM